MRIVKSLLKRVKTGDISVKEALEELKFLPFENLGSATIDTHRALRRSFPEVVYGEGKSLDSLYAICRNLIKYNGSLLLTRGTASIYKKVKDLHKDIRFDKLSRLIYLSPKSKKKKKGMILIMTAGTSDMKIAREAEITASCMGNKVKMLYDQGVSGIHRILKHMRLLRKANVIIVIAGMEGALASVVSGLVSKPVIAVPTSVGYGSSFRGLAPLLTMLNSCSPGVSVVNIDNGFGAGYFASMVNK